MRVGTALRILGIIIFLAGLLGGFLIGFGTQALITSFFSGTYGNASASGFSWATAITAWLSSSILSALIYAIGAMSNNLDEMNAKLEEVQNNTLEAAKALRHIAHIVDKQLAREVSYTASNGTEPNAQYAPLNYMRQRKNSTEA